MALKRPRFSRIFRCWASSGLARTRLPAWKENEKKKQILEQIRLSWNADAPRKRLDDPLLQRHLVRHTHFSNPVPASYFALNSILEEANDVPGNRKSRLRLALAGLMHDLIRTGDVGWACMLFEGVKRQILGLRKDERVVSRRSTYKITPSMGVGELPRLRTRTLEALMQGMLNQVMTDTGARAEYIGRVKALRRVERLWAIVKGREGSDWRLFEQLVNAHLRLSKHQDAARIILADRDHPRFNARLALLAEGIQFALREEPDGELAVMRTEARFRATQAMALLATELPNPPGILVRLMWDLRTCGWPVIVVSTGSDPMSLGKFLYPILVALAKRKRLADDAYVPMMSGLLALRDAKLAEQAWARWSIDKHALAHALRTSLRTGSPDAMRFEAIVNKGPPPRLLSRVEGEGQGRHASLDELLNMEKIWKSEPMRRILS